MALSFHCQICSVDMSTARIRTADEPPSAAWDTRGMNYVGFSQFVDYNGDAFRDRECRQCTTADRTPADIETALDQSRWPDHESENDGEWLPDSHHCSDNEALEYDSEVDGSIMSTKSSCEIHHCSDSDSDAHDERYPLSELYQPPPPKRLPRGTWRDGFIYYGDGVGVRVWKSAFGGLTAPPEHVAFPSCQSLQGINGNVSSVAQMKNCRNHRFLVARPTQRKAEVDDQLFEASSLFCLTGESNGSYAFMHRYFYPPRYGLRDITVACDMLNEPCDVRSPDPIRH